MDNFISRLEINNFKSIKKLELNSCKRINVFIGEPNVGKSNILEALSLFLAEVCSHNKQFLEEYIRYEKLSNLFYDQDRNNIIKISTNIGCANLRFHLNSINQYDISILPGINELDNVLNEILFGNPPKTLGLIEVNFYDHIQNYKFKNQFKINPFYAPIKDADKFEAKHASTNYTSPIKRYIFKSLAKHTSHFPSFVRPPYGDNLYTILESNPLIYDEATAFFSKYGLDLLVDAENEKLEVQKRVKNRVYKIPFSLSADTLQRIIFHLAAISTNKNSIIIFEEPEAHSFPKYISLIAERIIQSKDNQFFIATHSPYILTSLIEECGTEEIAINICTYKDYQTKVRELTAEEIGNIMETGIDLFYNLPAFQE